MQETSKIAVAGFLRTQSFNTVLDAPSGGGWLLNALGPRVAVDGIDLYVEKLEGYRRFWKCDLDDGLPAECLDYDLACCCEGLEHVGNPLLLLKHFYRSLKPNGLLVVTTPNVWYPQSRLQYLLRGFFPSFPSLAGKVIPGTHMHISPWSWPQLYVFLQMAGFRDLRILREPLTQAKHWHERLLAIPARACYRRKEKKAATEEDRAFWRTAATDEALLSRHLILIARKP